MKKLILAIVATFVAVVLTDMLIHRFWLSADYGATASLWRPEAEMTARMHWMFIGQFIVAAAIATIYVKALAATAKATCATYYGLCVGLIAAGSQLIMFAVAPYPGALVAKWFFAYVAQGVVLGQVLYWVCKPRRAS